MPWGPRQAAAGVAAFVVLLVLTNVVAVAIALAFDLEFRTRDVGDTFEKAARVAAYAAERLDAASRGAPLPEPPRLLADQASLQVLLAVTAVSQAVVIAIVGIASLLSPRDLVRALGLHRPHLAGLWLPLLGVFASYLFTFAWVAFIEQLGVSWLEPVSTVPFEITRDPLTLSIGAAVALVGAPVTEELFFRGLVFGGLTRWGFWPAAAISGTLFSLVHFDPGSIVPFFAIALILAWLYHRSRTLWHPILFHLVFNAVSFAFLLAA